MSASALRLTPQRRAVLDVVAESDDHPTAGQVLDRVRERVEGVGAATVYRTLALLVESGQVAELRLGQGQALRYDHTVYRHAHLVCTACGQVQDTHVQLDVGALANLEEKTSFTVAGYDVQLHGRCARCAAQDKSQGEAPMTELKGSKTHANLKEAFAGESMANRRYLFFARQADKENITGVAELFRETAEAETGHAFGHAEYLVGVGDPATDEPMGTTEQNLASAVVGETYEFTAMYPGFASTAREEGFEEVADWFSTLARAERTHAGRYQKALDKIRG